MESNANPKTKDWPWLKEISKYPYKHPIAVYREAVSNSLDVSDPNREIEAPHVEIYTNAEGDVFIEDWGTGIENLDEFLTIAEGEKRVRGEISSYEKVSDRIIGQKGLGKLSFLSLSSINTVEFFSNSEKVGLHIILTDDFDVKVEHMNSELALPHHGLMVVIRKAKMRPDNRVIEYLQKVFAWRIVEGARIFVNGSRVTESADFDPKTNLLFVLSDGTKLYGNLKKVEKPKTDNVDIYVKKIRIVSKGFSFKVEGRVNCDRLELITSREEVYEGNELFRDFMTRLMRYLEKNFEKKSDNVERRAKSEEKISKYFVDVIRRITVFSPELTTPYLSGNISDQPGMGKLSEFSGEPEDQCVQQGGSIDKNANETIGKPLGDGRSHKHGNGESKVRVTKTSSGGKILSPPKLLSNGTGGVIPQPTVIPFKAGDRPVVYLSAPNRLIINIDRPASNILLEADPKNPELKFRIMPLLVRAGIDAFPGAFEMPKGEWFRLYVQVLDSLC